MAILNAPMTLGAFVLGVTTSCYSPEFRDCSVSCASTVDCASGQICGSDQLCAAPELAGRCALRATDAGTIDVEDARPDGRPPTDARPPADAPPANPDAPPPPPPPPIQLHVKITGNGRIDVVGIGSCDTDCTYSVAAGVPVTLKAVPDNGAMFEKWTSSTCAGQGSTCVATPTVSPTDVSAKFKGHGNDDMTP